jgi:hypothetical protein
VLTPTPISVPPPVVPPTPTRPAPPIPSRRPIRPAPPPPPDDTPPLSLEEAAQLLARCDSDEAVFDVGMRYIAQEVPRLWALLIKGGELTRWRSRGAADGPPARAPFASLPTVAQTLVSGEPFIGQLQPDALGALAQPLGIESPGLALLLPVRIGAHPVGLILGFDCSLEAMRHKRDFQRLGAKLDQALHVNYLRRQILAP